MNTFPGNAIPQYPGPGHAPPPHMVYPGGVVPMGMQIPPPGMAPGVPGVPGVPPGMPVPMDPQTQAHMAMIQQQQMHAAQMAHQQMMMRQAAQPKKGKKQNRAAAQVLSRHMAAMAPPHGTEQYAKGAMAPPAAPTPENVEPFADLLDELDARELAMARFRARNEMMAEVFGPEPIKDIPDVTDDPWAGLGLNGETLEAKVLVLESSNSELEGKFDAELDAFRKRLEEAASPAVAA